MPNKTNNHTNHNFFESMSNFLSPNKQLFIRDINGVYLYANKYFHNTLIDNLLISENENIVGKDINQLYPNIENVIYNSKKLEHDLEVIESNKIMIFDEPTYLSSNNILNFVTQKVPFYLDGELLGVINVSESYNKLITDFGEVTLTIRQLQTLSASFHGLPVKEIGCWLNISPRTVDTYVEQLKNNLNLNKKSDFNAFIIENKLYEVVTYFYKNNSKISAMD